MRGGRRKSRGPSSSKQQLRLFDERAQDSAASRRVWPLVIGAGDGHDRRAYTEDASGAIVLTGDIPLDDPWWGLHYGPSPGGKIIVGQSAAMRRAFELLQRLAACKLLVLIFGETGTGKELFTRALASTIAGPFVPLSCAGLPDSLIESELFGYVKGAFTGAQQDRPGWFEAAERGTLFLDDIQRIGLSVQAKLLRVLDTNEFCPVGSRAVQKADTWVICATNRCLEDGVCDGWFSEDLYFRLLGPLISLPPLRERGNDSLLLAVHFIMHHNAKGGRRVTLIDRDAAEWIRTFFWPGNVRELNRRIETAFVLGSGAVLRLDEIRDERTLALARRRSSTDSQRGSQAVDAGTKGRAKPVEAELLDELRHLGHAALPIELSRNLTVHVRTVERRLKGLVERGLVTRSRVGKKLLYSVPMSI